MIFADLSYFDECVKFKSLSTQICKACLLCGGDCCRIRIDLGLNERFANDRNLFIKVYRILINTILVYNVKILTMQAAIIKIGKFF